MNKIETYRRKYGLTQEELAKKAGIDRAYISVIENGGKSPTVRILEKIAHALNCEVKDLI